MKRSLFFSPLQGRLKAAADDLPLTPLSRQAQPTYHGHDIK